MTNAYVSGVCENGSAAWAFVVDHSDGITCSWNKYELSTDNVKIHSVGLTKLLEHMEAKNITVFSVMCECGDSNLLSEGNTMHEVDVNNSMMALTIDLARKAASDEVIQIE